MASRISIDDTIIICGVDDPEFPLVDELKKFFKDAATIIAIPYQDQIAKNFSANIYFGQAIIKLSLPFNSPPFEGTYNGLVRVLRPSILKDERQYIFISPLPEGTPLRYNGPSEIKMTLHGL